MENSNHNNNLSLLKFIASLFVILSHSSEFVKSPAPINLPLGTIAVSFFFFVSGYYSIKSIEKYNNDKLYIKNRIIAIIPLLVEVALISVFIIGPLCTNLPLKEYFMNINTYKYLLIIVMIRIHSLPGVFENSLYGNEVNGSLWTLPFQCICYIVAIIVSKIKLFKKRFFIMIFIFVLFVVDLIIPYVFDGYYLQIISSGYRCTVIFLIGIVFYYWKEYISINIKNIIILFVISCALFAIGFMNALYYIFLPYIVFYLLFSKYQIKINTVYLGKLSYPIYLLAWPVQQTLAFLTHNTISFELLCTGTVAICILAGSFLLFVNNRIKNVYNKSNI